MSRELNEICNKYNMMPHGEEKIATIKRGYMLADEENNARLSIEFRLKYISENSFYGDKLQIYLVFPEVLKIYDENIKINPYLSNQTNVMWYYKYVVQDAVGFYQVSQKQFEMFADDFERRMENEGKSLRSLYLYKALFYVNIDKDKAAKFYDMHLKLQRDSLSDCIACERSDEMRYLFYSKRFEEALEKGGAIFDRNLTCAEQPYEAYGALLDECCNRMLSGDFTLQEKCEECIDFIKKGLRKGVVYHRVANIILYYTLTGNKTKALTFFKNYSAKISRNLMPKDIFEYDIAVIRLFKTIGKEKYKLSLPLEHPAYREDGIYNCSDICEYYIKDAIMLADKFDTRNNTKNYKKRFEMVTECN